ncbi:MAG: hypothetical protein H7125_11730, partial [Proteobacteria bacterium]|nr:hypothetical protein [Burkholderiales bacterium]
MSLLMKALQQAAQNRGEKAPSEADPADAERDGENADTAKSLAPERREILSSERAQPPVEMSLEPLSGSAPAANADPRGRLDPAGRVDPFASFDAFDPAGDDPARANGDAQPRVRPSARGP